jgi:geranylgeranylglycerol-phosphate geranylgeranyltransferase
MYILNDLIDSDLDKANGKKRPIPSGQVSKRQAWIFIASTNGLAVLLSAMTLSGASILILVPMVAIGIMYSAPRIALMNRFVLKTLSISVFYALCAFLGITSAYGIESAIAAPAVPVYSMALLGMMIFISSTLNDLGDIEGDKSAKRKTVPIVLGSESTMRLLILLAVSMIALSAISYGLIGPFAVTAASLFSLFVISKLRKIEKGFAEMDTEAVRLQHKKLFPMHVVLQMMLAVSIVTLL